ncbi:MAG: DUF4166 domain-containing protein [Gallionellaceae bacterium]|jgi:hypothetical protein|nr:DUF4166 domain-containing protein [Gallionellaceae bacterium]
MQNLMQRALGDDWHKLPPALQAHYQYANSIETGHMDIEYPRWMQPALMLLRRFGALVDRSGKNVTTVVERHMEGERQRWHRTMTWPDGKTIPFNSLWIHAGGNRFIEFVNPALGLEMAVHVDSESRLHYQGVRFVIKLGCWLLPIPEWLALGHTTIIEHALSNNRFAMDFRLTHPLFGQVFRYAGEFQTN